jgi:hypothetical protein
MRDYMASGGMDLEPASRFMFEQLAARQFWVSTQPDMTESFAKNRIDYLRAHKRPELSPQMRAAFES